MRRRPLPAWLPALLLTPVLSALPAPAAAGVDAFWRELQTLCGQAFRGTLTHAPDDDTALRGKPLTLHVRECGVDTIRIPFVAGDDRSRVWVLDRHGDRPDPRLELRHVHRHEDGREDAVSQYGGLAPNGGAERDGAQVQIFPADAETAKRLPDAATNVWLVAITPDRRLVYEVRRMGTERHFRVEFDLTAPVATPPPPWGWTEGD